MSLPFKGIIYETCPVQGYGVLMNGRKYPCSDMELNAAECLEAYGVRKGGTKCAKYIEDLRECKDAKLRAVRWLIMREERMKKVAKGEIPFFKRYGKPYEYDSIIDGAYIP